MQLQQRRRHIHRVITVAAAAALMMLMRLFICFIISGCTVKKKKTTFCKHKPRICCESFIFATDKGVIFSIKKQNRNNVVYVYTALSKVSKIN